MANPIFKIVTQAQWDQAAKEAEFVGAPVDLSDGYIHFSTATQVKKTAELHFAGQDNLVLFSVDADTLGASLVFEASRGGDMFPHLYGKLAMSAVMSKWKLPLDDSGNHVFPEELETQ